MQPKHGKIQGGSCPGSMCESLDPANVPAVDPELEARVGLEFERFLEMRDAVRRSTGRRRRALLSGSRA